MRRRTGAAIVLLVVTSGWLAAIVAAPPAIGADRAGLRLSAAAVYLAGSRLCHQRPDRSFSWRGTALPVCARCFGLYAAAPVGVLIALVWRGRLTLERAAAAGMRRAIDARALIVWAAVPTTVSVGAELTAGLPSAAIVRALSAAPLGAVVAWMTAAWLGGDLASRGAEVN